MLNEQKIIEDYKSGLSIKALSEKYHVSLYPISSIIHGHNLPAHNLIKTINQYPDFEE